MTTEEISDKTNDNENISLNIDKEKKRLSFGNKE